MSGSHLTIHQYDLQQSRTYKSRIAEYSSGPAVSRTTRIRSQVKISRTIDQYSRIIYLDLLFVTILNRWICRKVSEIISRGTEISGSREQKSYNMRRKGIDTETRSGNTERVEDCVFIPYSSIKWSPMYRIVIADFLVTFSLPYDGMRTQHHHHQASLTWTPNCKFPRDHRLACLEESTYKNKNHTFIKHTRSLWCWQENVGPSCLSRMKRRRASRSSTSQTLIYTQRKLNGVNNEPLAVNTLEIIGLCWHLPASSRHRG